MKINTKVKVVLVGGRVLVGNLVIDDPRFIDLVWTEPMAGPNGVEFSINMQANIPREATTSIEVAPES